jgi:sulfate transport system substrate-binding protein
VVTSTTHLNAATAFKNFQYTAQAQRVWAAAGFRPVDPAVAAEVRDRFPAPAKLWTIADLGGWSTVDKQLFDKSSGSITSIYTKATG